MAIQKGILKIEGTVGGLTFYKSKGQHLVKEKGGVPAREITSIFIAIISPILANLIESFIRTGRINESV